MGGIAKWRHRNTLRWVHLTAEPLEAKKWPRFITLISQSQGGLAIAVKSYKDRWDVFLNCFFFFFFLPTGIKTTIHNNSVPLSYSFSCLHLAFFSPSIFSVWMFLLQVCSNSWRSKVIIWTCAWKLLLCHFVYTVTQLENVLCCM